LRKHLVSPRQRQSKPATDGLAQDLFPFLFFRGLADVFYRSFLIPSTVSGQDDTRLDLMMNRPTNVSAILTTVNLVLTPFKHHGRSFVGCTECVAGIKAGMVRQRGEVVRP
jgi:hypothetical protein